MDRRTFIKSAAALSLAPTAINASTDSLPSDTSSINCRWPYIVYCYEREQGEWVFSKNVEGSFNSHNEYKTFDEESWDQYCGFMYDGKLHFYDLERAADFIHMHMRTKNDVNLADSIYDVYYANEEGTEIHVAHYWYNGDTGSQIHWVANKPYMNWSKVECA